MATFEELNPYASPREIGDWASSEFGVGVWKDGGLLVIHPAAALPAFCVKTGEPTRHRIAVTLDWTYAIDWRRRTCKIQAPLTISVYDREFVFWQRIQGGCILWMALCLLFAVAQPALPIWCYRVIGWSVPAAILILILSNKDRNSLLKVAKRRNGYLWLRGADETFLERLPTWPGSSA
jgi:hypothetical protein